MKLFVVSLSIILLSCSSVHESVYGDICDGMHEVYMESYIACVSTDYYAVDNIRMPMGLDEVIDVLGDRYVLPTKDLVDAIYSQADIQLQPITMQPGPEMTSVSYYQEHNRLIEEQLSIYDNLSSMLIAGHKKDILYTPFLETDGRVTIYGWHTSESNVIQPVSRVHGRNYFDYSHGLRLVSVIAYGYDGEELQIESQY